MSKCRVKGPSDLFITFTCNSIWIEFKNKLGRLAGQLPEDIPNIVAGVFRINLEQLQLDLAT